MFIAIAIFFIALAVVVMIWAIMLVVFAFNVVKAMNRYDEKTKETTTAPAADTSAIGGLPAGVYYAQMTTAHMPDHTTTTAIF